MSNYTVSAGITVLSYRPFIKSQIDIFGELEEEGLESVWESNAEHNVNNSLLQQGIDPVTISDAEFKQLVKRSMDTNPQSDIRLLINREPNLGWSAPKQNLLDGVLYFYLGEQRPKLNVSRCLKEAIELKLPTQYVDAIRNDREFIFKHARHIIGMARVTSKAISGSGIGFNGRNFVDVDTANFHVFEYPLSYDFMVAHGQATHGSTVLSIPGPVQEAYRHELQKKNKNLPAWYTNMQFGGSKIPYINQKNWLLEVPKIDNFELSPTDTSNPEFKVCYYFVRHLVEALQDPKLPDQLQYLEQVSSMRNGQSTGKPDYLLRIHDTWVPLEAKVAVNTEQNILGQVSQYIKLNAFRYRDGKNLVNVPMRPHGVCLLADQYGIYMTHNGEFIECTPYQPRWDRRELKRADILDIRNTVAKYL